MLDFMRALERQALRLYENQCFGRYDVIEQTRAANIHAMTARLMPDYPNAKITLNCTGLRLRIIGDASAAQNDGFYCQFRLYPSEGFLARHVETLSVFDLSGAGWIDVPPPQFQLSQTAKF